MSILSRENKKQQESERKEFLSQEITDLEKIRGEKKQEVAKINKELESLRQDKDKCVFDLVFLKKQFEDMLKEGNEIKARQRMSEEEITYLEKEISEKKNNSSSLGEKINGLKSVIDELNLKLEAVKKEMDIIQNEKKESLKELEMLENTKEKALNDFMLKEKERSETLGQLYVSIKEETDSLAILKRDKELILSEVQKEKDLAKQDKEFAKRLTTLTEEKRREFLFVKEKMNEAYLKLQAIPETDKGDLRVIFYSINKL